MIWWVLSIGCCNRRYRGGFFCGYIDKCCEVGRGNDRGSGVVLGEKSGRDTDPFAGAPFKFKNSE